MLLLCVSTFLLHVGLSAGYLETICEGATAQHLHCGHGTTISVTFAEFGRTDEATCAELGAINKRLCRSNVTDMFVQKCDDKVHCGLVATTSVLGDPCPGTSKYLKVFYKCKGRSKACDKKTLRLKCPSKGSLNVITGLYGRTDSGVCRKSPETSSNVNCYIKDSTQKLQMWCNTKSSCNIAVKSSAFGKDTCPETHKYVDVTYTCS